MIHFYLCQRITFKGTWGQEAGVLGSSPATYKFLHLDPVPDILWPKDWSEAPGNPPTYSSAAPSLAEGRRLRAPEDGGLSSLTQHKSSPPPLLLCASLLMVLTRSPGPLSSPLIFFLERSLGTCYPGLGPHRGWKAVCPVKEEEASGKSRWGFAGYGTYSSFHPCFHSCDLQLPRTYHIPGDRHGSWPHGSWSQGLSSPIGQPPAKCDCWVLEMRLVWTEMCC